MVKNFLFHRVNPQRDRLWDPMDVALFEKCIDYISRHYKVVLLEEWVEKSDVNFVDEKIATILFDDGYKDNIEFAFPILKKYGVKASFYVVTQSIDKNTPTWTHELDYSFQYTESSNISLQFAYLPLDLRVTHLDTKEQRMQYVRKLKPALKSVTHEEREQVMHSVRTAFSDISLPALMMNWDDLRLLKSEGHYVGSHTVSHPMLGTMTNEDQIREELAEAGLRIQKELGYFPASISYPVGSYNETTMRLSKECGYKMGLAVKQRIYQPGKDDLFEIPRIELYNESWVKTYLRINGVVRGISKIIKRK